MSQSRNKFRGVYKVAFTSLARMHKIFAHKLRFGLRTRVLLRRFMRRVFQIGEDAAALCYQRVSPLVPQRDETFSPRAICQRQCALPRDSSAGLRAGVSLLPYRTPFLNTEFSPSALPRSTTSLRPVPFVPDCFPSFRALRLLGVFYILLFCPIIIYPGNIALALLGPPLSK